MFMATKEIPFDPLVEKLSTIEAGLKQNCDTASLKLAKIRKEFEIAHKEFEDCRLELDNFQKTLSPKFSVVRYKPGVTDFYRASYRHFDTSLGKSQSRVVHLGPIKDFEGPEDPNLHVLAKNQIVKYLANNYPGLYDGI